MTFEMFQKVHCMCSNFFIFLISILYALCLFVQYKLDNLIEKKQHEKYFGCFFERGLGVISIQHARPKVEKL